MGLKEYNEGLDQLEREHRAGEGLHRSLAVVADKNPDEEARRRDLSRRTGIPADWIPEFKDEVAIRSLVNAPAVQSLPKAAPKTASWMSDTENASVSHDDVGILSSIERIVGAFRSGQQQQVQGRLGWRVKEGDKDPALKSEISSLEKGISKSNRRMQEQSGTFSGDYLQPAAQVLGQMWEGGKFAVSKGLKTGLITGAAGVAAGPAAPVTVPAAALGGLTAGTTYGFFEDSMRVEGGLAYLELSGMRGAKGESLPEESVRNASTVVGIVNGALELGGMKVLSAPWKKFVQKGIQKAAAEEAKKRLTRQTVGRAAGTFAKTYAAGVSAETAQEIAQEITNVLAEETLKSRQPDGSFDSATLEQVGQRLYSIGSQTARAMAVIGVAGPGMNLQSDIRSARAARVNQETFQALGEASANSKLRGRLPEKFREFVDSVTAEGPLANVFIPVEQWNTYWQEQNVDPGAMATEVLGESEQYQEAIATGGDLVIPTGRYAEVLAGTEHHAGLAQDLRLHPGEMTLREAEEFRQNFPDRAAALDALEEPGEAESSDQKVFEDVLAQLTRAGRAPDVAAREATLWQVRYRTRAQRLGVDPFELYQERPVKISGPGLDVRAPRDLIAPSEEVRESPHWKALAADLVEKKYRGKKYDGGAPLLERLGSGGRIMVSREDIRGVQAWENGLMPFFTTKGKDAKGKTLKWDVLLQSLKEEGYLRADAETLDDLVEAIQSDQEAKKTGGPRLTPGGVTDYEVARMAAKWGYFQEGDDKRGFIRFGPKGELEIGLLEKANLSTFLHETGHAWLEELRADASRPDAPEQIREDWARIEKYLGIEGLESGAAIPVEAHEKFARTGEAYLMEGKAPSAELASAFARFKAWLVQIYREISRLNVTLQPEVRGVFDRLVASDEEIESAREKMQLKPIFATAEAAGMTQAQFESYRNTVERESAAARDRLERKLIAELEREKTQLWKAERGRVRAAVEEESRSNAVFQVYHLLTQGELLDGSRPAVPVKLSRKAFIDAYGQEFVDRLPPKWFKKMTAPDGMHPDLVAEMFGFPTGMEMIRRLQEAPPRTEWIEQETDRRMKEGAGDYLTDGSIAEEAIDAVHHDRTGQILREELRALRKINLEDKQAAGKEQRRSDAQNRDLRRAMEGSIPPVAAFREAARQAVRNKSVMSLRPDLYMRAEQKAGKAAFKAAARNDWEKAGSEKKKQLLNHFLYMEARKAQEEVDSIYQYVKTLQAATWQERLGLAGGDYLAQVNGLLEQYEFRQVTNKAIEERRSLVEWAKEQADMGLEPDIPPVILYNAKTVNYRELKLWQLSDLRDALTNIEHLARQQGRLLGAQADVSFKEAVLGLIDALHDNVGPGKKIPIDRETRSTIEKAGDRLTEFHVALLKAEQFVEWADGRDIGGAWNTYIFQPIADAQAAEGDLTRRYTSKLANLVEAYVKAHGGATALKEKIRIRSLGESLTRQAIVAAGLNTGNEGNLDKLLGGRGWSEDQLNEVLSHLSRSDWEFVQATWDLIESMWPDIAALQKRMTGLEPKKVEARKFSVTVKDGDPVEMRGGYYPAVYDPIVSTAGAKQLDAQGTNLFEGAYVRAATEKGHTKERTAYKGPIQLSLEVIPQHFATVIHDLTHREAIVQAWRLLNNQAVKDTITETMGAPYFRMLNLWTASVATDRNAPPTGTEGLNRLMDRLRLNTTIVAMGFKATTVIAQALDIVQSFRRVKGRYLVRAIGRFYRNPSAGRAFVHERSGEMRHRESNLDRDLRDLGRSLMGKKGILPEVQRAAMRGIAIVDMAAAIPTWLGAYEQALQSDLSETDAIHWADRAVRLSNPAGGAKDLAAIQRDPRWKLFTMFYSFFNVMYQAQADTGRSVARRFQGEETVSARDPRAAKPFTGGELAIGALSMWIVPALMGELLAARGPDDDEEWWQWSLRNLAVFPFLSLPGIRDVANALESGREYQMTPVAGAFASAVRTAQRAAQVAEDDREPEDLIAPALDLIGYTVGLPTGQAKITGRYVWDLMEGETPESAGEAVRNLVFYRKK